MDYSAVKELIQSRRSVRRFQSEKVSIEQIKELIDCARYAPSDTNSQTWEWIAICNEERIQQIKEITDNAIDRLAQSASERGLEKEGRLLKRSFGPYATAFADAPVLMIALATPYTSKFREKIFDPIAMVSDDVWKEEGIKSSCLAIQNFMLAAHAMGLGTCAMTGPVLLAEKEICSLLSIPSDRQLNMVIALGVPTEQPKKLARKSVDEILTIIS